MDKKLFTVIVVPHDPQRTRNYKVQYWLFYVLVTFLLIGMVLKRISAFSDKTGNVLNLIVIYISLPALILLKRV